jgi:CRP/FNR family cyclic AMP-dependent transcriptional regulator
MAEAKKIQKDSYLFREGDVSDAMFIVRSGHFAITKTKGNSEIVLADVGPGSMIGEMALFDKKPRSANIRATKDAEVLVLPFESLNKQLEQMPVWFHAIIKTMSETIREANKKIKFLENPNQDEDRFPPHVINKFISIINFVGLKYGKPDEHGISFSSVLLRNYTIQIFQEPTNKMQSVVNALCALGFLTQEERGDGTQKITNLKPQELFQFVDWYNDWLFKPEGKRLPSLTELEARILSGILQFAKKATPDAKNLRKVNLSEVQNESMKETGNLIKGDDVNPLIEKKYLPEKIMAEGGVYLMVNLEELEPPAASWAIATSIKRALK